MSHTRSPWSFDPVSNDVDHYVFSDADSNALICRVSAREVGTIAALANAKLIVAAPELASVLADLEGRYEQLLIHAQLAPSAIERAMGPIRAALAKVGL